MSEFRVTSAWLPVTDEVMAEITTGDMRAYYEARIRERVEEGEREWRALPWYTRVHRTLYYWSWRIPQRIHEWIHRDGDR